MTIQLKNVHYRYPEQVEPIFSGLHLEIERGEVILLEGSNGAGKTSLLRILAGIIPKFTGGEFNGEVNVGEANFGMVFQGSDQQFVQSRVDQEILFILENQQLSHDEILHRFNELVTTFYLEPILKSEISKLSTGERQLLKIALAFILNPNVILMDEPLSHLDEETKALVLQILSSLKGKMNLTFVIADHEPKVWNVLGKCRHINLSNETMELDGDLPIQSNISYERFNHIQISNVTFSYNKKKLIENFNQSVNRGDKIILVGGNGSGKTTLLKLLIGQLEPVKGSILKQAGLRCKFLSSSSIDYFFSMRVREEFNLENKNVKEASPFLMEKFENRYVFDLSQGERKKAALNLVSHKADLIFLDEPFAHLDLQARKMLIEVIDAWVLEGKSVIFTAQSPRVYEKWVHQIWKVGLN